MYIDQEIPCEERQFETTFQTARLLPLHWNTLITKCILNIAAYSKSALQRENPNAGMMILIKIPLFKWRLIRVGLTVYNFLITPLGPLCFYDQCKALKYVNRYSNSQRTHNVNAQYKVQYEKSCCKTWQISVYSSHCVSSKCR